MSVVSRSYEDQVEVNEERMRDEPVQEEVGIIRVSPRYKGKNPKTPEQLAADREARKAKMREKNSGLYESKNKMVSHPSHYQLGKYEVIDIIKEATKDLTGIYAVDLGNALKYLLRWNKKGDPKENLEKAMWEISHMIKNLEEGCR